MAIRVRAYTSAGAALFAVVFFTFCLPLSASALSTIEAVPAGDGVILLQGNGIQGAAALDITVRYDTALLANPRVTAGPLLAGAMTAVNPDVPGTVRIVAVRLTPVNGSGLIATMSFERRGASSGGITALITRLADLHGAPLLATSLIADPPAETTTPLDSSQDRVVQTDPAPSVTPIEVAIPVPVLIERGTAPAEGSVSHPAAGPAPEQAGPPAAPDPDRTDQAGSMIARSTDRPLQGSDAVPPATRDRSIYRQTSVLERFLAYRGERTLDALLSLVQNESLIGCHQTPAVALSDGRTTVRFVFVSTPGARTSSDISVMGAKLLSLRRDPDNTNTWIVDLLPDRGAYTASIAVPLGDMMMVYPLAIAPKADIGSAALDRYLRGPGWDLNGDGKRDGLDDFIFTANYLQRTSAAAPQQQERPFLRAGR